MVAAISGCRKRTMYNTSAQLDQNETCRPLCALLKPSPPITNGMLAMSHLSAETVVCKSCSKHLLTLSLWRIANRRTGERKARWFLHLQQRTTRATWTPSTQGRTHRCRRLKVPGWNRFPLAKCGQCTRTQPLSSECIETEKSLDDVSHCDAPDAT